MHSSRLFALAFALCVAIPGPTAAQAPPPGATGTTVALEGTTQKVYAATHVVIVKTVEGIEYAFRYTRDLLVHGGKPEGPDTFPGLREGTTVVVHYTGAADAMTAREIDQIGDGAMKRTEGVVRDIDRRHKEIVIRFDNGTNETFRLTNVVTDEMDTRIDPSQRVVIYYSDEGKEKVAHYFKKMP